MLGRVVTGSRTWMCTMAAQALAASMADCAICCGVTGTAGFFPGVSAYPVTAHEIITLRCMVAPASCQLSQFSARSGHVEPFIRVMAALVPAIHVLAESAATWQIDT